MPTAKPTSIPRRRLTNQGRRTIMTSPAAMRSALPSGDLISAILQYADVQEDQGGARVLLRLSPRRMADPVIAGPLGREAHRLAEVAVVWDDDEGQIQRVLDAAAGDRLASLADASFALHEEPLFELTGAALAYLNASQGCA